MVFQLLQSSLQLCGAIPLYLCPSALVHHYKIHKTPTIDLPKSNPCWRQILVFLPSSEIPLYFSLVSMECSSSFLASSAHFLSFFFFLLLYPYSALAHHPIHKTLSIHPPQIKSSLHLPPYAALLLWFVQVGSGWPTSSAYCLTHLKNRWHTGWVLTCRHSWPTSSIFTCLHHLPPLSER